MTELDDVASDSPFLIWEDAAPDVWWLARAHHDGVDYLLARDPVLSYVLLLRHEAGPGKFKVIGAIPMTDRAESAGPVAEGKRVALRIMSNADQTPYRRAVMAWRVRRWFVISAREMPLALGALLVGAGLSFIVSAFFITVGLDGWIMVAVGTALGIGAGFLLKWLADRKFASLLGPRGRFVTVALSASLGAFAVVAAFKVLFDV